MKEQNLPEAPEAKQFSSADFADSFSDDGTLLQTAAGEHKQKRKIRILFILVTLCILLGIGFICNQTLNYYDRVLRSLHFDYRDGESVTSSGLSDEGEKARAIAETINGSIHISATEMWFDIPSKEFEDSLSGMEYEMNGIGETLSVKTGIRNWFLTKKRSFRRMNGTCEEAQKGEWTSVSDAQLPCLTDFCFSVSKHDDSILQFNSSCSTSVGSKSYTCEIWLLETKMNGFTYYFTLYRYYGSDDRLAAVRVLPGNSDLMTVYDIKHYSFT